MVIALFIQVDWHWHWPKLWPMVEGVVRAARDHGDRVLIYGSPDDADCQGVEDLDRLGEDFAFGTPLVDGMVMTFPEGLFERYAEVLHRRGVPVVVVGRRPGDTPRILCDNFSAIRDGVLALARRGHTRIAFLTGREDNLCAQERRRGYTEGLAQAGLAEDTALVFRGDLSEETGRRVVAEQLRAGVRFSALIAANDGSALGAMEALRDAGKNVPEDVEVVGFDNLPRARWSNPPLSSFEMQAFQLGHRAARDVARLHAGEEVPLETMISAPFVSRATSRGETAEDRALKACMEGWAEGRFYRELEEERLRQIPAAAELLSQLEHPLPPDDAFPWLERLLAIVTAERIPAGVLYSVWNDAARAMKPFRSGVVERGLALLANAAVDEQKRDIATGVLFTSLVLPLRDLGDEAVDDDVVVDRLGDVLAELRVPRAALFLNDAAEGNDGWVRSGRWWDLSKPAVGAVAVSGLNLSEFLQQHAQDPAFYVMPLKHKGQRFGVIVLSVDSAYLSHYPNLVEELGKTLHGARTQSARQRAEAALRERESQFRSIFDNSNDALFVLNGETLLDCNTKASELFRRSKSELIAQSPSQWWPENQPDGSSSGELYTRHLAEALKNSRAHFEWVYCRGDGTRFEAEVQLSVFELNGEQVVLCAVRDITSRRAAEKAQRELESRLQLSSKLESVGSLAAGVAHEINTPVQFISNNINFLLEEFPKWVDAYGQHEALKRLAAGHEDCAEALAAIRRKEDEHDVDYLREEIPACLQQSLDGLKRISRIVRSLKEFSHPGGSDVGAADLNRAIETTLAVSRHEWKYVAEAETDLDPDLPLVRCVIDEINQAVLNLVVNAAHAVEDANAKLGRERGLITVRTRKCGEYAVIEVQDTGTGIPAKVRGSLFDPFFTTKDVGRGTGQGLAIAQAVVVQNHQGRIEFDTVEGEGTTFRLMLPLPVESAAAEVA